MYPIQVWGTMPYIKKNQLHMLLQDLPEVTVPGRTYAIGAPLMVKWPRISRPVLFKIIHIFLKKRIFILPQRN